MQVYLRLCNFHFLVGPTILYIMQTCKRRAIDIGESKITRLYHNNSEPGQ